VQKITTWYQNNIKVEKAQKTPETSEDHIKGVRRYKKNYTAKEIAKHQFKDLIVEHIQTLTDANPGSPDWLKHYPSAHKEVFNNLDEEQQEQCERIAERWNTSGPSPQIQAK
jgi:hypothetical protein